MIMADVKLLKLVSGEEILATVKSMPSLSDPKIYPEWELTDVIKIVYYETEKGLTTAFAPYLPMAEGDISIKDVAVICSVQPKQEVLAEYSRIFTGLVIPQKSGIIV